MIRIYMSYKIQTRSTFGIILPVCFSSEFDNINTQRCENRHNLYAGLTCNVIGKIIRVLLYSL